MAQCVKDNFPFLSCRSHEDIKITYNLNAYTKFFFYPNPRLNKALQQAEKENKVTKEYMENIQAHFEKCKNYANFNKNFTYSAENPKR